MLKKIYFEELIKVTATLNWRDVLCVNSNSDFLDSWGHFLDEDLYQKSFKKKRKESTKTKLENDRKHFLESIKVLDNMETQIQEKKKNNLLKGYNPFILYEG